MFDAEGRAFNTGSNDEFIELETVATEIKKRLHKVSFKDDISVEDESLNRDMLDRKTITPIFSLKEQGLTSHHQSFSATAKSQSVIYVETDQYYGHERFNIGDKSESKVVRKAIKSAEQRASKFLNYRPDSSSSGLPPVVAADIPFLILREFGTLVMTNGFSHLPGAHVVLGTTHAKYKRILKTFYMAIDNLIRLHNCDEAIKSSSAGQRSVHNSDNNVHSPDNEFPVLLYSICDDKFDLLTLGASTLLSDEDQIKSHLDNSSRGKRKDKGKKR